MRKTLIASFVVLMLSFVTVKAAEFDVSIPVKGNSAASQELQRDSLFTVYSFALRIADKDCQKYAITDSKVINAKKGNSWNELWTINACSKTAYVPIKFTEKAGKSTYAIDPMLVKYAK